jgi:putative ABC transport system ATP-binding protein
MALLNQLHEKGNTIVLVTHEDDIAEHAQRVVGLKDGLLESDKQQVAKRFRAEAKIHEI